MLNRLIKILVYIQNRKKQRQVGPSNDITSSFSLSGKNEKELMKINVSLTEKDIGLYLDNDFIVLDRNKSLLLIEMLKKGLNDMESYHKMNIR